MQVLLILLVLKDGYNFRIETEEWGIIQRHAYLA